MTNSSHTTLCLDCAGRNLSLYFIKNQTVLAELELDNVASQAETLLPSIDELLKKTKLDLESIDSVLYSIGPGSFTGLRVGLATLQGLFVQSQVRWQVLSSLLLRTLSAGESDSRPVAAVVKLGRGRLALGVLGDLANEIVFEEERPLVGVKLADNKGYRQGVVTETVFADLLQEHEISKVLMSTALLDSHGDSWKKHSALEADHHLKAGFVQALASESFQKTQENHVVLDYFLKPNIG